LRRQLDQVVLHEQVENDVAISKKLNANKVDQRFETPRRVSWIEQRHPWTKDRLAGHNASSSTDYSL
jgi:hypothetical protein